MITRRLALRSLLVASMLATAAGCTAPTDGSTDATDSTADELRGPGAAASDARVPELGKRSPRPQDLQGDARQGIAEAAKPAR